MFVVDGAGQDKEGVARCDSHHEAFGKISTTMYST